MRGEGGEQVLPVSVPSCPTVYVNRSLVCFAKSSEIGGHELVGLRLQQ